MCTVINLAPFVLLLNCILCKNDLNLILGLLNNRCLSVHLNTQDEILLITSNVFLTN